MAIYTEAEIQSELDYYKSQMRTASNDQAHGYSGPAGNFSLSKASLKSVQEAFDYWWNLGQELYPDTFATTPRIGFTEAAFIDG